MNVNADVVLNFLDPDGRESRLAVLDGVLARDSSAGRSTERLLRLVAWHSKWEPADQAVENVALALNLKNTGENA